MAAVRRMANLRNILLFVVTLLGAVFGFMGGIPIWRSQSALPFNSIGAWLWLMGGFTTFVGGVLLIRHFRVVALIFIFAGFVLLFTAGTYLPEARRVYDQYFLTPNQLR